MKKIFVTVGTFKFDSLIEVLDNIDLQDIEFTFQIGEGTYTPKKNPYFRYSSEYGKLIESFDYFITHAGAGTVYDLLEKNKKILIVPNLDRVDSHQLDIAKFVVKSGYGLMESDLENLTKSIPHLIDFKASPYVKEKFFKATEIIEFIKGR